MQHAPMLGPVIALVLWTHAMWLWMYATRIPAITQMKMRLDPAAPRGQQMSELPASVRWKADNYNHLFEQPTVFYAVAIALAIVGDFSALSVGLAWAYVALRVVHSLWQALVNVIIWRFAIFTLSALLLMALSVRAAIMVF
ncbi:MAG TPA: MAPEG family protein [Verrucomicrobiae bacterium]|nr:MAPEG family protein [Verrucomicrobiae bacterium]